MRLVTPVEVSLCTTITALILWRGVGAQLLLDDGRVHAVAASRRGSGPRPTAAALPWRATTLAKCPVSTMITRSPAESVLTIAASHAPVPLPGKITTGPEVWNTRWQPSSTVRPSLAKSGPRWSIVGMSMARRTRSGTLLGPGIWRKCRPALWAVFLMDMAHPLEMNAIRFCHDDASRINGQSECKRRLLVHAGAGYGVGMALSRAMFVLPAFAFHAPNRHQALRLLSACALSFGVVTLIGVPEGYWSLITAITVMQPDLSHTLSAGRDRVLATLLGAAVGIGLIGLRQAGPAEHAAVRGGAGAARLRDGGVAGDAVVLHHAGWWCC